MTITKENSAEADICSCLASGDNLAAYDLAERALTSGNNGLAIRYLAVLSLARCGATSRAQILYRELSLDQPFATDTTAKLAVDVPSLWGRLAKDAALKSGKASDLDAAASIYWDVFTRFGHSYPAVNASTLWLMAGQWERAAEAATATLSALTDESTKDYWAVATEAEARIALGQPDQAEALLQQAANMAGKDWAAMASTRRQLAMACKARGFDASIFRSLRPPNIIHFTGHMIGRRFAPDKEPVVAKAVQAEVERCAADVGYGSLAGGSDILFAEALLARGAELHVVIPFDVEEFKAISIAPCGADWQDRFDSCLARATSVEHATSGGYRGDDALFRYAAQFAMGSALLRARFVGGEPQQIAVWDGERAIGQSWAGTAADVARWISLNRPSRRIEPATGQSHDVGVTNFDIEDGVEQGKRSLKALIFGDMKGFSKLRDDQMPAYVDEVIGRLADTLKPYAADIVVRNTWGDGIYIVLRTTKAAAGACLALQRAMAAIPLEQLGLPTTLGLRLAGHCAPVFELNDPITGRVNCFGHHVSRAARIEPVTPEGEVYVTDAFAADLAASGCLDEYSPELVGRIETAKAFGKMRMYALRCVTRHTH